MRECHRISTPPSTRPTIQLSKVGRIMPTSNFRRLLHAIHREPVIYAGERSPRHLPTKGIDIIRLSKTYLYNAKNPLKIRFLEDFLFHLKKKITAMDDVN